MPETYNQVAFGSFVYDANNASAGTWREDLQVRSQVVPVPRSHRALARDGYLGTRMVAVEGMIEGTSLADLRTQLDAFLAAHMPGHRNLYRDNDRYLVAEVRRLAIGELDGLLWVPYSVQFEAADPYYYAATASEDTWLSPADTGTHVVTTAGAVTAAPTFAITLAGGGASLTLTLTNQAPTPDEAFTLTVPAAFGGLLVGDVLTVDTLNGTVTLTRGGATTNRRSWLTGTFWELQPGKNTLHLALSGGPTLASIVTVYRDRWL